MIKKEKFSLFHSIKRSVYFFVIRIIRYLTYLKKSHKSPQYLFVLSPPYCGSTMLTQLLSSSNNVSCNNYLGTREGQLLPGVKHFMFKKDRWNPEVKYPWQKVKKIWLRYWDYSKPIFLDKSIPNIMRVDDIQRVFRPIKYICMVRNPYAQVEGIIRRNRQDAKSAAEFAIKCLRFQSKNKFRNNSLFFTYEELCENGEEVLQRMIKFVPELSDININIKFSSHNFKTKRKMRMTNLNSEKISKISDSDLRIINTVFRKDKDLLSSFNYKIIER